MSPDVRSERREGTLLITLDRQEVRNALTWDGIRAIGALFGEAAADEDVRAVAITGAGEAFCAGGDINDQRRRADWASAEHVVATPPLLAAMRAVWECPKPVVAAVNGVAAGGGAGLALLSDVRIVTRSARLGFSYPRIGLAPDFGVSWTLPRLVGPSQAARLLFTAAYVDAEEAVRIGLADELVDDGASVDAALALCRRIAAVAPLSVRWAKAGLRRAEELSFPQALEVEMLSQHLARSTDDHGEGVQAFLERRAPRFTGR